ncbi:30S ribosomal protein S4 [Candidatus Uhrbacteria bacterium RIFCSPLOWO2_12_FULL_46_10]|uniref:Small ribosomal subunit protein uS4 n=1 Tax=Candidatus Uhrbacteria bacterium RIFCSPLOWO2_01_FULL_47_25 TaxID=1802402 RepID=A0A1F7UZF5_9BACT|nr:MAG: 30S ribosomal protein S4 [Parcubacteria group bacterium GW2011_GWA2_46_9]OGL61373.1 MAG: 30S ribosomal protein S4 [Candidatus Uhrbacteria bacterium RIFCSPHIGHO2_01_FULL_46_23]OGL70651.1 MAG: 30S ribosomal protein S4 [Candidatus Uhrbacteria bacterium RIFCSPHIGHO2_02_FULL_47_29]OGL76417.1 MAG: 30S ribosomal protein S4 [Candidatus Uhrbacteria bacterium RIFCSPHIGHO2_12_FULL_46_13]OGL83158.1 MAG: 30S ribosomal protein S4 [Candidatus Uhrbacteria bacterium RIFCSPLOWO2_01_FULL_47_25]OGL84066.1
MGRLLGPKHHICRRLGERVCTSAKCPMMRRSYPPGVHGPKGYGRITEYGTQLREKQKVKYTYGIMEKQFRRYYNKALSQTGNTAELFLQHLERRLDNIVYRLGLARSRQEARQITTHGWILVNNKRVNIPSYEVKMGDVIALKEGAGKSARWQAIEQYNSTRTPIGWLAFDNKSLSGKVMSLPTKDDFPQNMNMTLVVEYYSR